MTYLNKQNRVEKRLCKLGRKSWFLAAARLLERIYKWPDGLFVGFVLLIKLY